MGPKSHKKLEAALHEASLRTRPRSTQSLPADATVHPKVGKEDEPVPFVEIILNGNSLVAVLNALQNYVSMDLNGETNPADEFVKDKDPLLYPIDMAKGTITFFDLHHETSR